MIEAIIEFLLKFLFELKFPRSKNYRIHKQKNKERPDQFVYIFLVFVDIIFVAFLVGLLLYFLSGFVFE